MFYIRKYSLIITVLLLSLYQRSFNVKDEIIKEDNYRDDYIIEIDKISLVVKFNSFTTLDTGLEIHEISKSKNSPLIIMGHSGIGSNVYFNNLFQLNKDDEIIIYNGIKKYTYYIDNIIIFKKGSKLKINKDSHNLYLVTCDLYNMQKQWIFSSKLAKIEEI